MDENLMDGHDLVQLSGQRHGAMIWGRLSLSRLDFKKYTIYMKPKHLKNYTQLCLRSLTFLIVALPATFEC
jgi:hypothetical protein